MQGPQSLLQANEITIVDIQMPKMDGLQLLCYLCGRRPKMPVVMLITYGAVNRAVEATKLGAVTENADRL